MKPKHVCKWRELKRMNDRGKTIGSAKDGIFVYCLADAKENFRRAVKERKQGRGNRPLRYPSTNHLELLSPVAAKEFRRQRRMGIEPQFDAEGLIPVIVKQSARKTRKLR